MNVNRKVARERRRVKRRANGHAILAAKGNEPTWNILKDESQLGDLLNWYSYNKTSSDAQEYFLAYLQHKNYPQDFIKKAEKIPSWVISTSIGWLTRIICLDEKNTHDLQEKYANRIEETIKKIEKAIEEMEVKEKEENEKKSKKKKEPDVQARLREQLNEILGEMEGQIDDFIENSFTSKFDFQKWFSEKKVKSIHAKNIIEYFSNSTIVRDLNEVLNGKDKELVEAYSHWNKSEIKKILSFIENIRLEAGKWYDTAKQIELTNRKPRTRKPKPPIKQVAKLKYLKEHENLKSIPPTEIVGASQLWVYNVKYRTLGVYVCPNLHGFSVKGCTLLNYDVKESIAKKLRKPDVTIPQVLEAGKVALRKILPNIRAKERKLTGRINKYTILLRTA